MLLLSLLFVYLVSAERLTVNVTEEIILPAGETVKTLVSIPEGYLDHQDFEDLGEKRNRFLWRVGAELSGNTSMGNPIRVVLQQGRTIESYKLPYTRTLDRSKGTITASLPARIVDLYSVNVDVRIPAVTEAGAGMRSTTGRVSVTQAGRVRDVTPTSMSALTSPVSTEELARTE